MNWTGVLGPNHPAPGGPSTAWQPWPMTFCTLFIEACQVEGFGIALSNVKIVDQCV